MTTHAIGPHTFALWRTSPPPPVLYQRVALHVRPGADGLTAQKIGTWGQPFEAVVVAHFATTAEALAAQAAYAQLPDAGPLAVIWDGVPYTNYGQLFICSDVMVQQIQVVPRLIGPGYDYLPGVEVVVRFRLAAIAIEELTP